MNEKPPVYIPTRGRWDSVHKAIDAWHKEGFQVTLVVEPHEADYYWRALPAYEGSVLIHSMSQSLMGVGYARNQCVRLAERRRQYSFILCDDDIKPARRGANMQALVESAKHPRVLGVTARYSYHDMCLGEGFKELHGSGLVLQSAGAFRLVALNTANVLEIGNYDEKLFGLEDNDLCLRGIKAGFPWMVHAGTWSNSIGTRYQPGGLSSFMADREIDRKGPPPWYAVMAERYPEVVSAAKTHRIRFGWKKAYDLWLPGWRRWSELDGGDINAYLEPTKHEVAW